MNTVSLLSGLLLFVIAPSALAGDNARPAQLQSSSLVDFDQLSADRKKIIEIALETGRNSGWLKYRFGGEDPKDSGFDCSGAVYYILQSAGLKPPRSSAEQYEWVKDAGRLVKVADTDRSLSDPGFSKLKPGDLLFWSGTYSPSDGRTVNISHVQIYLGREKEGDNPVMIGSSDGRSYHGKKQNGYGVFDFSPPQTRGRFVGYGTPPGVAELP